MRWTVEDRLVRVLVPRILSEMIVFPEKRKRKRGATRQNGIFSPLHLQFISHKSLEECVQQLERQTIRTFDFKVNTWMTSSDEYSFELQQRVPFGGGGMIIVQAEGRLLRQHNNVTTVDCFVQNSLMTWIIWMLVALGLALILVVGIVAMGDLRFVTSLGTLLAIPVIFTFGIFILAYLIRYKSQMRILGSLVQEALA